MASRCTVEGQVSSRFNFFFVKNRPRGMPSSFTQALQQAGLDKATNPEANEKLNKAKCGVLVGSGMGGLQTLQDGVSSNEAKGSMSPFVIPYSIANMGGSLVAIEQGFMGPNYSIATACATANYCFCESADHIRSGKAEVCFGMGSGIVELCVCVCVCVCDCVCDCALARGPSQAAVPTV